MKKINLMFFLVAFLMLTISSCEDLETVNKDPNNPQTVPSNMLFSGAQKKVIDYVYDNWFGGRQSLVYSQYWAQRNYTEEDRYQVRESVNNNYFNYLYVIIANMNEVIALNSNPETAGESALYGNNNNQIAAAKIMKAWIFSIITDTWGSVPYFEVGKLKTEDIYYPKYDSQEVIYEELIKELTEAANMIDEDESAFIGGDRVYGGDAAKWRKFANSLKCRLALHTSKVSGSKWNEYIAEALASGVFESNADAAAYHYIATSPEFTKFYNGTFIEARNDFTIARPFADILKGVRDTLNNKTHPWEGALDPRLSMFTTSRNNAYIGMPYGIASGDVLAAYRNLAPNWYTTTPPVHLKPDFSVPLMTYAEMQFIISEYKGFSMTEYKKGVEASIDYWSAESGISVSDSVKTAYVNAVTQQVNAEAVALQKYIDLYINGTEAWTEIRRTGYPNQLLKPGEISVDASEARRGVDLKFEPLADTKGLIIPRVKYPTNESTLNTDNFLEAVSNLQDGTNNYYTPMFWDKRSLTNPHPVNK